MGRVQFCMLWLTSVVCVLAASSCPTVSHVGTPAGEFKNVSGIQTYHTYPTVKTNSSNVLLHVTDIYGVPLLENKLLADSLARASGLTVIVPDLFAGDAVPVQSREGPALNLTAWSARHPTSQTDAILSTIINYIRSDLGAKRIGAVGYCFGGKFVPRFLAAGKGIDVGFIAHPSNLATTEIQDIAGPISIAIGELDNAFNITSRRSAEDILTKKNATYQTNLYSGAPHGFGVRPNLNVSREVYAKEASFLQALGWFDAWL